MNNISPHMLEIQPSVITTAYRKSEGFPGVYCWGYRDSGVFIPLYVGKSRNVFERLIQHYCRFKSGEYRILSADELHNIYVLKTSNKPDVCPIYIPDSFQAVTTLLLDVKSIHESMILNFVFRCVHIADESERILAEKNLANFLGRGRLITRIPGGGDTMLNPNLMPLVSPSFLKG
jgi:hypothetical protein